MALLDEIRKIKDVLSKTYNYSPMGITQNIGTSIAKSIATGTPIGQDFSSKVTGAVLSTQPGRKVASKLKQISETPVNLTPRQQNFLQDVSFAAGKFKEGTAASIPVVGGIVGSALEPGSKFATAVGISPDFRYAKEAATIGGEWAGDVASIIPAAMLIKGGGGKLGTPKLALGSAAISGTLNKVMGGSFKEGVISGVQGTPAVGLVGQFTNPAIEKVVQATGNKFVNPIAKQLATRTINSILNIAEGVPMNIALNKAPLDKKGAIIDAAVGFILTPGVSGDMARATKAADDIKLNGVNASPESFKFVDETLQSKTGKQAIKNTKDVIKNTEISKEIPEKVYYHGTSYNFDTPMSARQLAMGDKKVVTANTGTLSPFVHLSESEPIAKSYAINKTIAAGGKPTIKEFNIKGNILDLSKNIDEYSVEEKNILKKIGKDLYEKSGQLGSDARIGGEMWIMGKGSNKSGLMNIQFSDIENSKEFSNILKENNISGIKFMDRGTIGNYVKTIAALPEALKVQDTNISSVLKRDVPEGVTPEIQALTDKIKGAYRYAKEVRKQQAQMVSREKGARISQAEIEKVTRGLSGQELEQVQRAALRGEYGKKAYSPTESLTQKDIDTVFNHIEARQDLGFFQRVRAKAAVRQLFESGEAPVPSDLKLLKKIYGGDFVKEITKDTNMWSKAYKEGVALFTLPKSLVSTGDFSAAFRQGWWLMTRPQFWANFPKLFRYAFDPEYYRQSMAEIENLDSYKAMYQLEPSQRLALTDPEGGISQTEEAFMSNLPKRIPVLKNIYEGSERSYTGFLNTLRASMFDSMYKDLNIKDAEGLTAFERNPELMKQVTNYINTATGRGSLGQLEKIAPTLNATLFSPRLMASRLKLLVPVEFMKADPYIRKQYIRDLMGNVATGLTVLGIAKMAGAEVKDDPRSADFGKIKIGNTRIDIWGGFQQYFVALARLITQKKISSTTGKEYTYGEGFNPATSGTILLEFLENKSAPETRMIINLIRGMKDSQGNKINVTTEMLNMMVPLLLQDIVEIQKEYGWKGAVARSIPGALGFGSQTYTDMVPTMGTTQTGTPTVQFKQSPSFGDIVQEKLGGETYSNIPEEQQKILLEQRNIESEKAVALQRAKKQVEKTGKEMTIDGKKIQMVLGKPVVTDLSNAPSVPTAAQKLKTELIAKDIVKSITGEGDVTSNLVKYIKSSKPDKRLEANIVSQLYKNNPQILETLDKEGLMNDTIANKITLDIAKEGNPQGIIEQRIRLIGKANKEYNKSMSDLMIDAYSEGLLDDKQMYNMIKKYRPSMNASAKNALIGDKLVAELDSASDNQKEIELKKYIKEIKTQTNQVGDDAFSYLEKLYKSGFLTKSSVRKILQGETLTKGTKEKYKEFLSKSEL